MASKGLLGLEISRKTTTTTKLQKENDQVHMMNEDLLHLDVDLNLWAVCPGGILATFQLPSISPIVVASGKPGHHISSGLWFRFYERETLLEV